MTEPDHNTTASPASKWDDSEFQTRHQPPWFVRHKPEAIGLLVLGVMLVLVIFWLPKVVQPVQPHSGAGDATSTPVTANSAEESNTPLPANAGAASAPLDSPWQDAQVTKARRQAQEILAKLLDQQNSLENMAVERWGKTAFEQAVETANQGDEFYRNRDFLAAQQNYELALQQFTSLAAQAEPRFQQAMDEGQQAITDQQPEVAVTAYSLATAMFPDSEDARAGLARAQVQEQVIEQLEAADNQLLQYQYDSAKHHVEKALQLDSESQAAKDKLATIEKAISEGDYASYMGRGYSLLQSQKYNQAISQFKNALAIKPGNQSAQDAITQAGNQLTQQGIQGALRQAEKLEANEQWQQALTHYQRAQSLDSSLVAARVGVLRTRARSQLDQQLQALIDEPLRLADPAVYRNAQQLLGEAASVKPRGPRIDQQQQQLQQSLARAMNPVAVLLRSDNETQVTLYKVGKLGNFTEHALELKPGRYTLVGSRTGYRDVREEFTLQPGSNSKTIVIQCEEKIALGG